MKKIYSLCLSVLLLSACQQNSISTAGALEPSAATTVGLGKGIIVTPRPFKSTEPEEYEYYPGGREQVAYDRLLIGQDKANNIFVYKRFPKDKLRTYTWEREEGQGFDVVIGDHMIYHPELEGHEVHIQERMFAGREVIVFMIDDGGGNMNRDLLLLHDKNTLAEIPLPNELGVDHLYSQIGFDHKTGKLDMSAFEPGLLADDFDYSPVRRELAQMGFDVFSYWISDDDLKGEYLHINCYYYEPAGDIVFRYRWDGDQFILNRISCYNAANWAEELRYRESHKD